MSNIIRAATDFAMYIVSSYITADDIVVDATCGNGNDTVRLAKLNPACIYAFDIQSQAINKTKALLISKGFEELIKNNKIRLINDSHENIKNYISGNIGVIMFNLGYLPGGNKSLTTLPCSTMTAVSSALKLLKKDGLLCLTMYSGHAAGAAEKEALLSWSENLDPKLYHTAYINMLNQKNSPPEILLITKKV